jgi:signal transduction histidine kinase
LCPLRNPLQSVLGSVGFLKDKIPKSDESYEDVTAIATGALDMARVVNDISDWVKVSVGQLELKRAPQLLQPLLDDVVSGVPLFLQVTFVAHTICTAYPSHFKCCVP